MELSRFEKGLKKLSEVDGNAGEHVIEALNDIAPDLGKYIVEFAFGDIYCRENLNLQEREMITLSSLMTLGGCENQLNVHINGALNVGITPKKIIEIFIQCIPYTGFPRVLNAVGVARQVFKLRNVGIGSTCV
jgi:4-carboxymuconolactone decarboxylase